MADSRRPFVIPNAHPTGRPQDEASAFIPRMIAWETTRACPLACKHCRATAQPQAEADELTTAESRRMLEGIAAMAKPTIILTGGEPMLRPDIYELAAYARQLGLRVVMAPCGMLLNDQSAGRLIAAGVEHISISIDGLDAASHDAFRGVPGAFEGAIRGIEAARRAGLSFQINTTVTRHNVDQLPQILELSVNLGASAFNPFLLVPTGRGRLIADQEISAARYEETLVWLADQQGRDDILVRVTCAPHYQRILRQTGRAEISARAPKGCMGGKSFAFISSRGKVQICGFLDVECGDLRQHDFNFRHVWDTSEVFQHMRKPDDYHGRCGYCEFRNVCGGCRARAFSLTGDYLAEEPFCIYQPKPRRTDVSACAEQGGRTPAIPAPQLSPLDRRIVSAVQALLPVTPQPYHALAANLEADPDDVLRRLAALKQCGLLRRIGPVFDSRRLGYLSTLVAGRIPPDRLEEVASRVTALPGVTHNYQRQHDCNLWFTLTERSNAAIEQALAGLRQQTGIAHFHSLPAIEVYKIRVVFDLGDPSTPPVGSASAAAAAPDDATAVVLDESQRQLVRLLQDDLPIVEQPFASIAAELGWSVERVVDQVRQWLNIGLIRRFGAVVRHHPLGFTANGMAVFALPSSDIAKAGRHLATCGEISHCYRRPSLPGWPYQLFAMIHGRSQQDVRRRVAELAAEIGAEEFDVLFSIREFKKVSMQYFLDEGDEE